MQALVIVLLTLVALAVLAGRHGVDSPGRVRRVTAGLARWPRPPARVPSGRAEGAREVLVVEVEDDPEPVRVPAQRVVCMRTRTRILLAWSLWLFTFACCAAGLVVGPVLGRM